MDKATQKKLKRAYVEAKRPRGVYKITNVENGRVSIDASVDVPSKINRDKAQLMFGFHPVRELLADRKIFGADSFTFETLELLEDDYETRDRLMWDLEALKQLYIDRYQPFGERGYNKR